MSDYGPDLFAGTAEFYARYRPAYPAEIFSDIANYFDLNGRGRLLDLGCGTGEIAIPLAKYFDQVLAIDPQSEMLKRGRLKAERAKADNIKWQKGSSEGLIGVKEPFKLATLGQSLHWMDAKQVLDQIHELLEPAGGLFIVGRLPIDQNSATKAKDQAIKSLITKYLGPGRRAGNNIYKSKPDRPIWEQDIFPNSKFSKFEKRVYQTKVVRNVDQELGNLYSTSWARRDFFGSKINEFEAEFRRELLAINGQKVFTNTINFEAFFLNK